MMVKYQCSGIDWAACIEGDGYPVLFLHGFPFDHTMYSAACAPLSGTFRVILPDLPGFGESRGAVPEFPAKISMEEYADMLAEFTDRIGERKVVLCGLSMGGYIAMQFARRHSSRLAGLILCDTRPIPDTPAAAANRLKLAETVFLTGAAPLADQMTPNLLSPESIAGRPETVRFLKEMITRQKAPGIAAAARGMAERGDSTEFLKTLSVPALAIGGADDKISPPEAMKGIADLIPGCRYVSIPGAGHLPPLETPALFEREIRSFLEHI